MHTPRRGKMTAEAAARQRRKSASGLLSCFIGKSFEGQLGGIDMKEYRKAKEKVLEELQSSHDGLSEQEAGE